MVPASKDAMSGFSSLNGLILSSQENPLSAGGCQIDDHRTAGLPQKPYGLFKFIKTHTGPVLVIADVDVSHCRASLVTGDGRLYDLLRLGREDWRCQPLSSLLLSKRQIRSLFSCRSFFWFLTYLSSPLLLPISIQEVTGRFHASPCHSLWIILFFLRSLPIQIHRQPLPESTRLAGVRISWGISDR